MIHLLTQAFFSFLLIVFFLSMILSWLPISPANPVSRFCNLIIGPILAPFDQRIPPIGMFRISFLIAWWSILFVEQLILIALPKAW